MTCCHRQQCADCGKMLRLHGWFAGWHLCLTAEEKTAKSASNNLRQLEAMRRARAANQERARAYYAEHPTKEGRMHAELIWHGFA